MERNIARVAGIDYGRGMGVRRRLPQGLKPASGCGSMDGLKPVPFKTSQIGGAEACLLQSEPNRFPSKRAKFHMIRQMAEVPTSPWPRGDA